MYCGHCGSILRKNSKYCGKCGRAVSVISKEKVVYVEEKPLTPILGNKAVLALTFCILGLSLLTIILTSVITRDIPSSNQLK